MQLPKNVNWINTSDDPPDKAISYSNLRDWYNQCIGVCIPLLGDSEDTFGYTNMLEAMAMKKPIVMTRSGCLDINPEKGGFGILVEPNDHLGWKKALNKLIANPEICKEMGTRGRNIVEEKFTLSLFNERIRAMIHSILKKP